MSGRDHRNDAGGIDLGEPGERGGQIGVDGDAASGAVGTRKLMRGL
jgi:hypothetical protein